MPGISVGRGTVAAAALALAVTVAWHSLSADNPPAAGATNGTPNVGGLALFSHWPQDRKPDAVLVLSNQTYGYLSPCGCSRPQRGGLERRYNFMQSLRDKGWPVVGLDGGDIAPPKKLKEQDLLKYETAMKALKAMGTAAVGLGDYDFDLGLDDLYGAYGLQNLNQPPVMLAANLAGQNAGVVQPRAQRFPGAGKRPWVEDVEVIAKDPITGTAMAPVGVTGVIGKSVFENKVAKIDAAFFSLDNGGVLKDALTAMAAHPAKPAVKVLLYTGTLDEAKKVAEFVPDFNVILCQIEEAEPPQFPTVVNNGGTFIIQVGHKGQNVGVVGVYRDGNDVKLHYQLVPLGEEYVTPKDKVAAHPVIGLMEKYSEAVMTRNLMGKLTAPEKQGLHANMVAHQDWNLSFVGSDKCKTCHVQEHAVWEKTNHGHAMNALEVLAVQPKNRQFDGDCVVCHTVGFGMKTGYVDEKTTAHLKHVGCETCHGPGSAHAAKPNDKEILAALSPWKDKTVKDDRLPAKAVLETLAKLQPGQPNPNPVPANQQRVMAQVGTMCLRCHDGENDPKFDLNIYMPKIWHSGFKAAAGGGLPGNAK